MCDPNPPDEKEPQDDLKAIYNPITQGDDDSPVDEFTLDLPVPDEIEPLYNSATMEFCEGDDDEDD